jgi:hypothetical protein
MKLYRHKITGELNELLTFSELIDEGLKLCSATTETNLPLSFDYKGWAVTHENDNCYLSNNLKGHIRAVPNDLILFNSKYGFHKIFSETLDLEYYEANKNAGKSLESSIDEVTRLKDKISKLLAKQTEASAALDELQKEIHLKKAEIRDETEKLHQIQKEVEYRKKEAEEEARRRNVMSAPDILSEFAKNNRVKRITFTNTSYTVELHPIRKEGEGNEG